ncbi:MAG: MATE family efflux transporter [Planctomycetes bacterium]|nr:MATE family efflux transporter [Planctomycetota bacterium]
MSPKIASDTDIAHAPGGIRELLVIALPMVVSHACDTVMVFTDRLFLSRLGAVHMNASMAGGLSCFMAITFFIGLTGYTTALVAQNLGGRRKNQCAKATAQAFIISLIAYPVILLTRPLIHLGFAKSGIPSDQLTLQTSYFNILIYGTIFTLFRTCLSSFFSGIGRTRIVMISALTAMVVNIGMNYVLIFGKLGLPALGIRGAAYGTIAGSVFGLMVLVAVYFGPAIKQEFQVIQAIRFDRRMMAKLLKFGYPAGVEMFLNLVAFTGLILGFHAHSPVTATAVTIMFNWDMVAFVPLIGIEISVMSLVGRYMGAQQPDIARRATLSGLKSGWAYSACILVLFVFLPEQLVALFEPQQADAVFAEAMPMAVRMIRIASLYVMIDAVILVFSGALRGAGDTLWAMCVSVGLHWLLVAILAVLLYGLKLSPETTWLALVGIFLTFSSLFYLRYRSGKWRHIQVLSTPS